VASNRPHLDSEKIISTVALLANRIRERFPNAGLNGVCGQLLEISRQARVRAEQIARPIMWLRVLSGIVLLATIAAFVYTVVVIARDIPSEGFSSGELIQVLDAAFNALVVVGATMLFLVTLETRWKRRRALQALHELRVIAHIIDMHQLTKDPERMTTQKRDTKSSPRRVMTPFELSRYLDYCSEMLSLSGKIAVLYAQDFHDAAVVGAVNEIEDMTTALSRKIWQKIMILHNAEDKQEIDAS
jgi:hypothetical protein